MSRQRNITHKVYLPDTKRENQYILAEFAISHQLIDKFRDMTDSNSSKPYQAFYQKLANKVFAVSENHNLNNVHFIANDKLARVRFSEEMHTWETEQQVLFFYNAKYHQSYRTFFDGDTRARKVCLLFLATGDEIYHDSAAFHQIVIKAVQELAQEFELPKGDIRIRDHQHLTYDLFAKEKHENVIKQANKIRPLPRHYAVNNFTLPEHNEITYVIANLPIDRKTIKQVELDENMDQQYNPLYTYISNCFSNAAQNAGLANGGIIANGKAPIIRNDDDISLVNQGELLKIGFNPEKPTGGYLCKWDSDVLISDIKLIFMASTSDLNEHGYGKFVNNIEKAMSNLAKDLNFAKQHNELMIRFHTHIGYNI